MDSIIKGKNLSQEEVRDLMVLGPTDITLKKLEELFAFKKSKPPKYNFSDYFVLEAGKCYNDKAETTTVGRYIFNKFILTKELGPKIKYMNYPLTDKKLGALQNKVARLFLEDKITAQENFDFMDRLNWYSFSIAYFTNSSLAVDFVMTNPKIKESKKKMIEKNANEIENGNLAVVADMEKELISEAKEIFKDHPSMQIYDSGCRGSFGNNYKNTSIMRGAIKNFADPSDNKISLTSLDEGIKPEDFKYYCDMSIAGTYSKAIETQDGKLYSFVFQIKNYICRL